MEIAQKYTGMNINSGFDSLFFGERYISRNILTNVFQNMRPVVQGSKDAEDALSCRSFFAKEPLIIELFYGKCPVKKRHPMTLRHSVSDDLYLIGKIK